MSTHLMPDGLPAQIIHLTNKNGMQLTFMDWGATWIACDVPLRDGKKRSVLLGTQPARYPQQGGFLGATVGRYANRIANAVIQTANGPITLSANQGCNHLHGGTIGFNQRRWAVAHQSPQQVTFTLSSADGDQGYPGNLMATVTYQLDDEDRVTADYQATVDKACPINLTNHAYFNLNGQGATQTVLDHTVIIIADYFLPVDKTGIPNAPLTAVADAQMDLRSATVLGKSLLDSPFRKPFDGYDHAYLLNAKGDRTVLAAQVDSGDGQLTLQLFTTKPALQIYTGNRLAGTLNYQLEPYVNYAGVALESEFLPDSPNHPDYPQPDCWFDSDRPYHFTTVYQFRCR